MDRTAARRDRMVTEQLAARGVDDPAVLAAMTAVPREAFVPEPLGEFAYEDTALPIPEGQTISQPYIVAVMAEALELGPDDRVLDVGTGSGYAAAVLSRIADRVFTIERHAELARSAGQAFGRLGYHNITRTVGDGSLGWSEHAPFDAIMVAAGGPEVPPALIEQLAPGGRLVIPVGDDARGQTLLRVRKDADGRVRRESLGEVRFVPLVGEQGWAEDDDRVGQSDSTRRWGRAIRTPARSISALVISARIR